MQTRYPQPILTKVVENSTVLAIMQNESSMDSVITTIDRILSDTLDQIMHQPDFQKLEASWSGVSQLMKLLTDESNLQVRLCSVSHNQIADEAKKQQPLADSHLYRLLYKDAFNMPGGTPYGILIGDYHFDHSQADVTTLDMIADICEKAFCPFITGIKSTVVGCYSWQELHKKYDLLNSYKTGNHIAWQQLRIKVKSRFIYLTAGDYLARHRYYQLHDQYDYQFNEKINTDEDYCWVNSAYTQAICVMRAYKQFGWCTAIRGYETGGKVDNLPLTNTLNATRIAFSDDQEYALSQLGIIPFCHYINTNFGVFFGCQSLHEPIIYDDSQATQNAKIAARLPYVLATSRIAHYIKVIARDKVGSFMDKEEVEQWLNRWIAQYVNANTNAKYHLKARFPLAEARIEVTADRTNPGRYHAVAHLKPWLQFESLSASLRLVTELPESKQ